METEQARYRKDPNATRDMFLYINNGPFSLDRLRNLVRSLMDNGDMHGALRIYTLAFYSQFFIHKKQCVEIFVEEMVRNAQGVISERKRFCFDSFFCSICKNIIQDPVTLKCGHTYSKKCMLELADGFTLACSVCEEIYEFSYLTELKTNVTILSLIEKFTCPYLKNIGKKTPVKPVRKIVPPYAFLKSDSLKALAHPPVTFNSPTSSSYLKKGNALCNFEHWKGAFKAFLTCITLDSNATEAKANAVKVLKWLLKKKVTCSTSDKNFATSESNNSINVAEDERSSDDDESQNDKLSYERPDLHLMLDDFHESIRRIADENSILKKIDVDTLDKQELECPLCMRMLWEPVTTTCGHTFCRFCINRSLDHQPRCPLCKTSLATFLAERNETTTEFIELAIKNLYPADYVERRTIYLKEMEELSKAGKDLKHEVPLFVCTVALPTVPCPLHIFEPRYRLMVRQCMESGSKQFGMCGIVGDEIAEFGTMLEIRNVQYFPDGRSIVDTIGRKRFRILRRGERDGYHTGAIEFLEDQPLNTIDMQSIQERHDRTYKISKIWFMQLPADTQDQILEHFGPMPRVETDYISSRDGPSWLWWMLAILPVETRLKILLISLTSLPRRLEFLYRILLHFQSSIDS